MFPGDDQGEVGSTLMQSKAAQDALIGQALQKSKYGGLITLIGQHG